jgi:hypothetical protein
MSKKNILILGVVIVIFAFAGFYLFNNTNTDQSLVADLKTPNSDEAQTIYNLLQKMSQVKLDDSIFSNQAFQSLKDNSIEILPQETGRENPFAPINPATVRIATTSSR